MTEQSILEFPVPQKKTRYDELREECVAFNAKYPAVWELFVKFTFDRINRGFEHYSAYAIFERIRWETDQAPTPDSEFKLNNNFRPFYARAFMKVYPEYDGFFRLRKQTSKEKTAVNLPPLGPNDYQEESM